MTIISQDTLYTVRTMARQAVGVWAGNHQLPGRYCRQHEE